MYNPRSTDATEFIDHDEILATLDYAASNRSNIPLMLSILEKGGPDAGSDPPRGTDPARM